jgi:hypothetical protein
VCAEMMDFVRAIGVLWFGLLAFYGTLIWYSPLLGSSFEGKGTAGMKIQKDPLPVCCE